MVTALSLAPFVPVSQSRTIFKPWWHNTMCCGMFDLALAAYLANDVKYTNLAICKQVEVLLAYATSNKAADGEVFSNVGEFFDMNRMLEFAQFIIAEAEHANDLALFKNFEPSIITWSGEDDLELQLQARTSQDFWVFPYEPAYTNSETIYREEHGYHFLHFGLILPGTTRRGRYKILQTARGRTVRKPVYRAFRLYHTARASDLDIANTKTEGRGYKWLLQFPWKRYAGIKTDGFTSTTPPKFSHYTAHNLALCLTQKG